MSEKTDEQGQVAPDPAGLVGEYYEPIYRYAYRLSGSAADAEDLTQQAFLAACEKLDQLRDPQRAKSWLFTIVRNSYLKNARKEQRTEVGLGEVLLASEAADSGPQIDSEELQIVLNELPEDSRTAVVLFYFQEFSYKEIASHLEMPIGTVMSRLARARQYLRDRLIARQPSADERQ